MPTVKELRAALGAKGLATDGKKAVLEARLAQADRHTEMEAKKHRPSDDDETTGTAEAVAGAETPADVARLLASLASKKSASRRQALEQLNSISQQPQRARDVGQHADKIASILNDDNESRKVQCGAVDLLSRLGPHAAAFIPSIVQMFQREHVGWPAAHALDKLGPELVGPHVASIVAQLADMQPEVREVALRALRNLGPAAQPATAAIVARLADSSSRVRAQANAAVQRLGSAAFIGAAGAVARHLAEPVYSNPSPYGGGGFEEDEPADQDVRKVQRKALRLLIKMTLASRGDICWQFCSSAGSGSDDEDTTDGASGCQCNGDTLADDSVDSVAQAVVSAGALPVLIDIMRLPLDEGSESESESPPASQPWAVEDVEAAAALTMTLCSCKCMDTTAARAAFEAAGALAVLVRLVTDGQNVDSMAYNVYGPDHLNYWTGVGDASSKGCAATALFNYVYRSDLGGDSDSVKHAGTRQDGDEDLGLFVEPRAVKAVIAAGAVPALTGLFHEPGANPAQKEWSCKTLFLLAYSADVEKGMWAENSKATMSLETMQAVQAAGEAGGRAAVQTVMQQHMETSSKRFFKCIAAGADTFYG